MRLETLFEKFDLIADAPDAVARLRDMVLKLAFSGEFSAKRNQNDSAPAAWTLRKIESICTSITPGFACSKSHQVPGGHVHLRTHNISTLGTLNFDLLVRIDPKKVDPQKSSLRTGDILFNNTNSQELVGKTCLVDRDYPYGFSNHVTRLRLANEADPGFVTYYLTLLRNDGHFARLCTRWINQAAINTDTLKEQTIPLPPLAEQKRIVAKVEELMAWCDRLESQLEERHSRARGIARAALARFAEASTPANLAWLFHDRFTIPPTDLRKAILTLAVQGKLVPQDPNDEPARPTTTRGSRGAKDEPPYVLPPPWRWAQLGDVSELINGDRSKNYPNKSEYVPEGVAWINTGHIEPDGTLSLQGMHYISQKKYDSLRSGKVQPGDLVYCLRGATLGKTAIITQFDEGAVASSLVIIRLSESLDSEFAYRLLTSPLGREQIYKFDNGSAQPNLSANNVKKYWVPLPPLAEQRRIVANVDALMALVDELETSEAAARCTATALLDALVAELTSSADAPRTKTVPLASAS